MNVKERKVPRLDGASNEEKALRWARSVMERVHEREAQWDRASSAPRNTKVCPVALGKQHKNSLFTAVGIARVLAP
jgi:hypothetical protein